MYREGRVMFFFIGSPGYCGSRGLDFVSFSGSEINDIMVQICSFVNLIYKGRYTRPAGDLTIIDFSHNMVRSFAFTCLMLF